MNKAVLLSTNFLRWAVGIFFLLSTIVYFPTAPLAGLVGVMVSALLIPPIEKRISKYLAGLNKPIILTRKIKIITATVLSFAFIGLVPSSPISTPAPEKVAVTPTITATPTTIPEVQTETKPEVTPTPVVSQKTEAKVVKVVDGDTLDVSYNGKTERIRVIGINTPETVDPRKPVECFGQKASDMAKEYLSGQTVWLEADPTQGERDKYSRLLRYIWTDDDSVDYGKVIIATGYAYEYTYNTPYKYQAIYKQAQKEAEAGKKGLWADNACPVTTPTPTKTTNTAPTSAQVTSGSSCKYSCSSPDRDCSDFSSHAEAQTFFNCCGFTATNDPMQLDGRNVDDGIACESI